MYEPKVGDVVTVDLPDERTRATIEKLISDTAAIVRLNHFVTATKSHNYRKGDLVPVRYMVLDMGLWGWRAVSERELADAKPVPEPEIEAEPEVIAPITADPVRVREMTLEDL